MITKTEVVTLLRDALRKPGPSVRRIQALAWDTPDDEMGLDQRDLEVLRDLAYDLEYFAQDSGERAEDPSSFGPKRAKAEIEAALARLESASDSESATHGKRRATGGETESWGPGNFENSAAREVVADVLKVTNRRIATFCASECPEIGDLDALMACVGVHLALHEVCGASRPDPHVAAILRERVVALYDEGIDAVSPHDEDKAARRRVLVETLGRYEQAAGVRS